MHFLTIHILAVILFIIVAALQVADGYLTWRILGLGGRELNPLIRFLMDRLGVVPGLVLAKLVLVVVIFYLVLVDQVTALALVGALYAWVVGHNWKQFRARTA